MWWKEPKKNEKKKNKFHACHRDTNQIIVINAINFENPGIRKAFEILQNPSNSTSEKSNKTANGLCNEIFLEIYTHHTHTFGKKEELQRRRRPSKEED